MSDGTATATTSYGTWNNHGDHWELTVEGSVAAFLGEFAHDYDVTAIVGAYRTHINEALPAGVQLAGSEFYGPAPQGFRGYPFVGEATDVEAFDDCPATDEGMLDMAAIVAGVDLGAIAELHDLARLG